MESLRKSLQVAASKKIIGLARDACDFVFSFLLFFLNSLGLVFGHCVSNSSRVKGFFLFRLKVVVGGDYVNNK